MNNTKNTRKNWKNNNHIYFSIKKKYYKRWAKPVERKSKLERIFARLKVITMFTKQKQKMRNGKTKAIPTLIFTLVATTSELISSTELNSLADKTLCAPPLPFSYFYSVGEKSKCAHWACCKWTHLHEKRPIAHPLGYPPSPYVFYLILSLSMFVSLSLSLSFPYSILEETLFGPSSWYKQSPSYGRILYCFYIQWIFPSIVFFCIYFHILCHAQTTRVKYSFSERRCAKLYIYERKT